MEIFGMFCGILTVFMLVQLSTCQELVAIEVGAKLPYPTYRHVSLYDGKDSIYIFGGYGGDSERIRGIYRYSIQNDTLTEVGTFSQGLYRGFATFDNDGNILYMGATRYNGRIDGNIYKLNISSWDLSVVGEADFGEGCDIIRAVDKTNSILVAGTQSDSSKAAVFCLNLETFDSCGITQLISKYHFSIRSFIYEKHAYLTGTKNQDGYVEKLNLNTLESELFDANLPKLEYHNIVFDGTYAYILGFQKSPKNGIIRLNPENLEHEFFPVENFPVNSNYSHWWSGSAVYIQKLNRIYFIGGFIYETFGFGYAKDEIWYIKLGEPATTTTTTETPISTTEAPITTTEAPTEIPISTTETPISTTLNPDIFSCLGKPNGIYPHPYDCPKFIGCRDEIATFYECLPPLLFSPILLRCMVDVDCEISCGSQPDGMYAHPHDCSLFLGCHNGIVEIYKCPEPLWFDSVTKQCDWHYGIECNI